MLNPEVAIPLVVGVVVVAAGLRGVLRHRERMARIAADTGRPAADNERLDRLEQAIEAIAVETERVGEGQRYLTRLLAERAERGDGAPIVNPAVSRNDPPRR